MKESQCKFNCGKMIHWEQDAETGRYRALESNGQRHICPNFQKRQQPPQQQQYSRESQSYPYQPNQGYPPPPPPPMDDDNIPGIPRPRVIQLPEQNWNQVVEQLVGMNRNLSLIANNYYELVKRLRFESPNPSLDQQLPQDEEF